MPFLTNPSNAPVLDPRKIVITVERLRARIEERFPGSGLSSVAAGLAQTAQATAARVQALGRPSLALRSLAFLAVVAGVAAQIYVARLVDWAAVIRRSDVVGITQGLDSVVNLLLLAFGAIWFVLTLERRLKHREILRRLFELRPSPMSWTCTSSPRTRPSSCRPARRRRPRRSAG